MSEVLKTFLAAVAYNLVITMFKCPLNPLRGHVWERDIALFHLGDFIEFGKVDSGFGKGLTHVLVIAFNTYAFPMMASCILEPLLL